jgi:tetratricopeptide (TPR) repeat protein
MGLYKDGRRTLEEMTKKSKELGDLANEADAQFRIGLHFMRFNNLACALQHWQPLINFSDENLSAELCFLKSSVKAFQACVEHNETAVQNFQREMKRLADATDYSYLMIGTPLMCAHQMEYLNRFPEALRLAEDAEKQALYYNQNVWLPRVRIKIFELQKILRRPPSIPKVYELLDMAKAQSQNHIVHACYKLLWEIDPQFEDLQKDWRSHWDNWNKQIPEEYRASLQPPAD